MLHIHVPKKEYFDERSQEFCEIDSVDLIMEHSLISISKWEAKWKKSYLDDEKTSEEIYDYFACMTISPKNVNPLIYRSFSKDEFDKIHAYINDPMSATTIHTYKKQGAKQKRITSEIIYYDMIALNIPIDFEKWHLNRLLTLIRVCAINSDPKKEKMSHRQIAEHNRALNKARRAKYHTKG